MEDNVDDGMVVVDPSAAVVAKRWWAGVSGLVGVQY
jgi:hypothetical protein